MPLEDDFQSKPPELALAEIISRNRRTGSCSLIDCYLLSPLLFSFLELPGFPDHFFTGSSGRNPRLPNPQPPVLSGTASSTRVHHAAYSRNNWWPLVFPRSAYVCHNRR